MAPCSEKGMEATEQLRGLGSSSLPQSGAEQGRALRCGMRFLRADGSRDPKDTGPPLGPSRPLP